MVNSSAESHDEVQDDSPGPPPLRLAHILLATAVAAMVLTVRRVIVVSNEWPTFDDFTASWEIRDLVLGSVALTFAVLGLSWRRPGWSFFQQPGHFLLLLQAIPLFNDAVWDLYWINGSPSWIVTYLLPIPGLAMLVLQLGAAWKGFDSHWWRVFFLAQVALILFQFMASLLFPSYVGVALYLGGLLTLISLASLDDARMKRRRDWLNWAGVAITTFGLVAGVVLYALWAIVG